MQEQRYTLKKDEKLRHKRLVDDLFANGKTLYEFPLRLTWRVIDAEELAGSFRSDIPAKVGRIQMLVTVPKRNAAEPWTACLCAVASGKHTA